MPPPVSVSGCDQTVNMKSFLNWSGGKDAAFSLYKAAQSTLPVEALVTTVTASTGRVSMHGVRKILIQQQAAALQLPLHFLEVPSKPSMKAYEEVIHTSNSFFKAQGFTTAVFGDLFLEDLKTYRENLYAKSDLLCSFPLWGWDTKLMIREFLAAGFKAIVVCVNGAVLDKSFCGRMIDASFLSDLPPHVDPCGENGEYHSFVFDGPVFQNQVRFGKGQVVTETYPAPVTDDCFTDPRPPVPFYFCDLLPV